MEGYKKCPYCGAEIPETATKCMYCTAWLDKGRPDQTVIHEAAPPQQPGYQGATPMTNVYVNTIQPQAAAAQAAASQPQPVRQKNGPGSAGLVLSILGLVLCWVPVANLILWFLGFLFSFIGMFKRPKGKAIAGLVISIVCLVTLIVLFSVLGNAFLESDIFDELYFY